MPWGSQWRPYVSVAQRRAKAVRYAAKLAKDGRQLQPVEIAGRKIATTFWGSAWCDNLESYSDFANRLPRGRTYARNGSVIDLRIRPGRVSAIVSGSELYDVTIDITRLPKKQWQSITRECSQSIDSLMDLLQGRFSKGAMERLARQKDGLFPRPKEIQLGCSCPDWAVLCKHVAAALYGVGARLDHEPELLFTLRQVDHLELVGHAANAGNLDQALGGNGDDSLAGEDLGELFGIDIDSAPAPKRKPRKKSDKPKSAAKKKSMKPARKNPSKKKAASKEVAHGAKPAKKDAKSTRKKSVAKKTADTRKQSAKKKTAAAKKRRSTKSKAKTKR